MRHKTAELVGIAWFIGVGAGLIGYNISRDAGEGTHQVDPLIAQCLESNEPYGLDEEWEIYGSCRRHIYGD